MGDKYDASQPSKYILYLDANALYSWAMMTNPLPTHGFKWMTEAELNNWRNIPCMLEVDLDYPEQLHDNHNEYPVAPENIKVGDSKIEKLVPNLRPKEKYVIHSETLELYESLGLKVTKIHRGIKFERRRWLEEYINLNIKLRTAVKNSFEKDFFKLS